MAKSKWYVVWVGRKTGVFTSWNECKAQVDGYKGSKYKAFGSEEEANEALTDGFNKASANPAVSVKPYKDEDPFKTFTPAEVLAHPAPIKIFSDGACHRNPGPSATGLSYYINNELVELWSGLYEPIGSNSISELNGLIQAVEMASKANTSERTAIFTDSMYALKVAKLWGLTWKDNDWKKADKKPVQNLELVKWLVEATEKLPSNIELIHVNGHVGIEGNELADRAALIGIEQKIDAFTLLPKPYNKKQILKK